MVSVKVALKLSERGHRVSFLAAPGTRTAEALSDSAVTVLRIKPTAYVDPWNVRRVRKWIDRERVDVVHCHHGKDLWLLSAALGRRQAKIPLVLTKHIGTLKPKTDVLHRLVYRRVDHIVAVSDVIRRNVVRTHPVPERKVSVIPNGVDLGRFNPGREARRDVRSVFGIPEDAFVIGTAGRLSWWKGYREFLETAAALVRKRKGLWFLAVGGTTTGEEDEAEAIHQLARSFDLRDQVVFTGFRTDMPRLYCAMDLFLYPAYAEAFGLVLIEAMAAGLAVVSTRCDGVPEIVLDGKTGVLVPARDSGTLIRAVENLLEHPELIARLGLAGRRRAENEYDDMLVTLQTERLYEKLIAERENA